MRPGRASQTAEIVCMARAAAHERTQVPRFSDPTALSLLSPENRAKVEKVRAGARDVMMERRGAMMAVRTVAVDDALRAHPCPQVVVLGAGLDGRAWRMPELANATVFEVDHPDSQRVKRERAGALTPTARSVHFVPVDFTKDDLDRALEAAGHDAAVPTFWIWEGVVMYLTQAQVEATLRVIERRSARGSQLAVVYHAPALMLLFVGLLVRAVGEPFRSVFTADRMRALLGRYAFTVTQDADIPTLGQALTPKLSRELRPMKHARVAIAGRA